MERAEFLQVLEQPQKLTSKHNHLLKDVLDSYPYFQSARALHLKALKQQGHFSYNQSLKVTAAHTTDRSVLFDFITSAQFNQNQIANFIKDNVEQIKDIDVNYEEVLDDSAHEDILFDQQLKDAKATIDLEGSFEEKVLVPEEEQLLLDQSPVKDTELKEEPTPEEILEIGKPLEFKTDETHSFNQWLTLASLTPIDRSKSKTEVPAPKTTPKVEVVENEPKPESKEKKIPKKIAKKNSIIDAFIAKNHKITPSKNTGISQNIAKAQMIQPEALMTETLARIYVEQKNYPKALQAYKILSLKYPEKSGFFADRINAVKQLQEKNLS